MSKLTRLTINKFRNVSPTTLEFRPGLNVLLGKNAAGKTTLLRLLSVATGVPDPALQDDEWEMNYHARGGPLDLEHTITRTRRAEPLLPPDAGQLVREEFKRPQQIDSIVFRKNGAVVIKARVLPNEVEIEDAGQTLRTERMFRGEPFLSLSLPLWQQQGSTVSGLSAEILSAQIKSAGRMDESLERFDRLLQIEVKHETLGQTISASWPRGTTPDSMFNTLTAPLQEGTTVTFSAGFLDRTAQILGYQSATGRFDIERLSSEPDRKIARLSNLKFFFKRPGEEISHDFLTYGQKRLLAFFAHADASRHVVIADELVNGLHHEWIEACLGEIGDRQAFLTSQNPLLLDFLRFESVEEVRRTFILCERTSTEAGAQLIWRNPTEDEAESFFSAYQAGIQRVSDILLTKGLW